MTNDPHDESSEHSVSPSIEDWLRDQAANEGLSPEELFQQLISAYWTLNELSQLITKESTSTSNQSRAINRPHDSSFEPQFSSRKSASTQQHDPSHVDNTDNVREAISDLEEKLQDEKERSDTFEKNINFLARQLTSLEEEITEVEDLTETKLSELEESIETVESDLRSDQQSIKSRLATQSENLHTILEYLISETDQHADQLSRLHQQYQTTIEQLETEQDLLSDIKADAQDLGTYSGECENCHTDIDIALLTEPYCPECQSTLTGIREETKLWIFSTPIVTTQAEAADQENSITQPTESNTSTEAHLTSLSADSRSDSEEAQKQDQQMQSAERNSNDQEQEIDESFLSELSFDESAQTDASPSSQTDPEPSFEDLDDLASENNSENS